MTWTCKPLTETHVAVLMGGVSAEREVSLKSGAAVLKALQDAGVQAVEVDVTSEHFDLPPDTDVAFLALHGTFGEDGTIQQLLEERGCLYTGSDALSSRLAFDKIQTKEVLLSACVPSPAGFELTGPDGPLEPLEFPVVVKPARQGSTIGVSIVRDRKELGAAYALARQFDTRVLVEQFIEGRELTVGILDDQPLPVIEIIPESGFFDYRSKYTKGATRYRVPAPLVAVDTLLTQQAALRAFHALGCRDYARVDIILGRDGIPYVLEVNTLPGMTATSLLPMAAAQEDIPFGELCMRIVEMALRRQPAKRKPSTRLVAA